MRAILLGTVVATSLSLGAASAQVSRGGGTTGAIPPVGEMSRPGEGTASPAETGSIASTGRVKPPGAPVGEGLGTRPDLERRAEELDRRIRTGICRGC